MWEAVRPTSLAMSLKVGTGGRPLRSLFEGVGSLGRGTRALPGCWLGAWEREAAEKTRKTMSMESVEKMGKRSREGVRSMP